MEYSHCPNCRSWPCRCEEKNFGIPDDTVLKILKCLERIEKLIEQANLKTALRNTQEDD
jgi:hypothetical protein